MERTDRPKEVASVGRPGRLASVPGARIIAMLGRLRERNVRFMGEQIRASGYSDLAPAHGALVSTLAAKGSLTMSALAAAVEKRKPTVTAAVKKLLKHGLVEAVRDEHDSRVTRVHLTADGREFAKVLKRIYRASTIKATRGIAQDEQAAFVAVLAAMLDNFDDYQ